MRRFANLFCGATRACARCLLSLGCLGRIQFTANANCSSRLRESCGPLSSVTGRALLFRPSTHRRCAAVHRRAAQCPQRNPIRKAPAHLHHRCRRRPVHAARRALRALPCSSIPAGRITTAATPNASRPPCTTPALPSSTRCSSPTSTSTTSAACRIWSSASRSASSSITAKTAKTPTSRATTTPPISRPSRATPRRIVHPGDTIDIPGLTIIVLTADGEHIAAVPGIKPAPNPYCATEPQVGTRHDRESALRRHPGALRQVPLPRSRRPHQGQRDSSRLPRQPDRHTSIFIWSTITA